MAMTMAERALLLAVVATVLRSTPPGGVRASAGARESSNTEFIRRRCCFTLYPSLCFTSLSGYATAVARDPIRLARVAANVSLADVRSVASHVASLRRAAAAQKMDARTASALGDCVETLGDAADLTRQATAQLGLLPTATGTEVAWRVSNAQTWMSAALTNEDTCVDGLTEVASPSATAVKANVCRQVRLAMQYTSNALALVNSLVATNR